MFELTRIKLLYGLSGVFTLAVAGLLLARPAPLTGGVEGNQMLAAQTQDPIDAAIAPERGVDRSAWKKIVVGRADSLGSAQFHFAVLPQPSGDQLAISSEWSRQASFPNAAGELRVLLISNDATQPLEEVRTIQTLVQRLSTRIGVEASKVEWH